MILDYPDTSEKRGLVILGNCQGMVMKRGLQKAWPLADSYRVHYQESWQDIPRVGAAVRRADCLFVQSDQGARQINRMRLLASQLPPFSRIVRFPPLGFTAFWPFLFRDHRAPVDPTLKSQRFPWGDRYLVQLVKRGASRGEALDRYMALDVPRQQPLDRLYEVWLHSFQQMENACDVQISDIILANLTKRRTFFSGFHVADFLILTILNRALALIGKPPVDVEAFEDANALLDAEMPVHPSVIRHFGIAYLDDSTRYRMRWGGEMTAEEFYGAYLDYLIAQHATGSSAAVPPMAGHG